MKNSSIEISVRLKKARINAGYRSARSFAFAHKYPYVTYSQHEAGKRRINPECILKYANQLNIDPAWLFTGKNTNHIKNTMINEEPSFNIATTSINPIILCNIFDELNKVLITLNIVITEHEKILICTEIYNKAYTRNKQTTSNQDILDVMMCVFKQLLDNKKGA